MLHAWDASLNELCTYQGNYQLASSPYLSKLFIYIFTDDQGLVAVSYEGNEEWSFDIDGRVVSAPIIAPDGSIYVEVFDNTREGFETDVYHLLADGTFEKFSLPFLQSLDGALVDSKGNFYLLRWNV